MYLIFSKSCKMLLLQTQNVIDKFINFTSPGKSLRRLPMSATSQLMVLTKKVNCGSNRFVDTNHRQMINIFSRLSLFVNLTAAYETVISYKLGFNCKLLRFLLNKCIVRMIIMLVRNKSFTLTATASKIISSV